MGWRFIVECPLCQHRHGLQRFLGTEPKVGLDVIVHHVVNGTGGRLFTEVIEADLDPKSQRALQEQLAAKVLPLTLRLMEEVPWFTQILRQELVIAIKEENIWPVAMKPFDRTVRLPDFYPVLKTTPLDDQVKLRPLNQRLSGQTLAQILQVPALDQKVLVTVPPELLRAVGTLMAKDDFASEAHASAPHSAKRV